MAPLADLTPQDRLIVALDVPTVAEALSAVERLPNVSFFKIGYELFITGGLPTLLERLEERQVFLDLKVPADIPNTVAAVVEQCIRAKVRFLTLSQSMPPVIIRGARATREAKNSAFPKFLTVPLVSSLDATDVPEAEGTNLETYVLTRAHQAIGAGCDGIIASGEAIGFCRRAFPHPVLIVSPGIRPAGASSDAHKRHTTPAEAIRMGADYLVVGRPILKSPNPPEAATRIIEEISTALSSV